MSLLHFLIESSDILQDFEIQSLSDPISVFCKGLVKFHLPAIQIDRQSKLNLYPNNLVHLHSIIFLPQFLAHVHLISCPEAEQSYPR